MWCGRKMRLRMVNPKDEAKVVMPSRAPTMLSLKKARPRLKANWTMLGSRRRTRPAMVQ